MLKSPHKKLINSLRHLEQSFDTLQKSKNNSVFLVAAQNACIERFTTCFDNFLRFSQLYFKHQYDVEVFDEPDSVLNFYAQFNICSYEDKALLYAMATDRQRIAQNEDADIDAIILRIPGYYHVINKIARSIRIEE